MSHAEVSNRSIKAINLDPAAEHFTYPVTAGKSLLIPEEEFLIFLFCFDKY